MAYCFGSNSKVCHQVPQDSLPVSSTEDQTATERYDCCAISCCFGIFIVIGIAFNILYSIPPSAYSTKSKLLPPKFVVDSVTVYPFNLSSSDHNHITANWSITFVVTNPNPETPTQRLEDVNVSVFYKEENISSTMLEPFWAYCYNSTRLVQAKISASSVYINNSIADAIVADWSNIGNVNFTLKVEAKVSNIFHIDPDRKKIRLVTLSCEMIKVAFSSGHNMTAGIMLDGPRECNVDQFVPK